MFAGRGVIGSQEGRSNLLSPIVVSGPQQSVFLPKSSALWLGRPDTARTRYAAIPLENVGGEVQGVDDGPKVGQL